MLHTGSHTDSRCPTGKSELPPRGGCRAAQPPAGPSCSWMPPHLGIYHADLCPVINTLSHPMWVAYGVAFGDGASSGFWALFPVNVLICSSFYGQGQATWQPLQPHVHPILLSHEHAPCPGPCSLDTRPLYSAVPSVASRGWGGKESGKPRTARMDFWVS